MTKVDRQKSRLSDRAFKVWHCPGHLLAAIAASCEECFCLSTLEINATRVPSSQELDTTLQVLGIDSSSNLSSLRVTASPHAPHNAGGGIP